MRRFSWFALTLLLAAPAAAQQRDTVAAKRPMGTMGTMRRVERADTVHVRATTMERDRVVPGREVVEANAAMKRRVEEEDRAAAKARVDVIRRGLTPTMRDDRLAERPMQVFLSRPRIGITIDPSPRSTDRWGAYVTAVTPGGPADKAGLRAGDVITKLAGRSVAVTDGENRNLPGLRLIEMIAKLEAGKAVEISYRRGGDSRSTKVTPIDDESTVYELTAPSMARNVPGTWGSQRAPREVEGGSIALSIPEPAEMPNSYRMFSEAMPMASTRGNLAFVSAFGGPLANLELASVNEKLGTYFGTSEGVLVIDVPEKDNMGLMPGDVITAIDGRKVSSPSQFLRVLRTYEKNEEFKLQVMRQKKSESITAKLP